MPFDLSLLIIVFLLGLLIVALSIAGLFNSLFVKNKRKYSAIILFSSCIICSIYLENQSLKLWRVYQTIKLARRHPILYRVMNG